MNADVILPVTTKNEATYYMAVAASRTLQASTTARLHAYLNNSPPSKLRDRLEDQLRLMGYTVTHWTERFSLTKIFNHGLDQTDGEFIAYATSDVLYFPGWLDAIVDMYRQHPEYFCI